jgi:hypothetical protein
MMRQPEQWRVDIWPEDDMLNWEITAFRAGVGTLYAQGLADSVEGVTYKAMKILEDEMDPVFSQ